MTRFVRTILTRGYELDARSAVSLGHFARYFEAVRWEFIRLPEQPLLDVFRDGGRLVMRAQRVEAHAALTSLEQLELDVAVAEVGGSSIRFVQRARRGGEVVARNDAVAVAIGPDKRPARVPDSVRAIATGEAVAQLAPLSRPNAEPSYSCSLQVRASDLDSLQHVNQSRYIDFVDDVYQYAQAARAYGDQVQANPRQVTIAYERETQLSPLTAERTLRAESWRVGERAYAFELVDPLDGACVSRAIIDAAYEGSFAGLGARGPRL